MKMLTMLKKRDSVSVMYKKETKKEKQNETKKRVHEDGEIRYSCEDLKDLKVPKKAEHRQTALCT